MDDVDIARSPILFAILGGIALLLFLYLYQSTRRKMDRATAPRRSLSYECVVTPLAKAKADVREKFPELARIGAENGVELVRFGLFNWGDIDLPETQIDQPVTVVFRDGTEVLSADLGETIKTDFTLPEPLTIDGSRIVFPRFGIVARGTLIFNFIVRGAGAPEAVMGEFEGGIPIRRLS
jgi:hypothetical protein